MNHQTAQREPAAPVQAGRGGAFGRLARLTLKELRETLRDRRTIITLVLMPVLLYPLLSVGLKQVFTSTLTGNRTPTYRIVVGEEWEGNWLGRYLDLQIERDTFRGGAPADPMTTGSALEPTARSDEQQPHVWFYVGDDLEASIRDYQAEVGVRVRRKAPPIVKADLDLSVEVELLYLPGSIFGRQAVEYLERRLAQANRRFLTKRLEALHVSQPAEPVQPVPVPVPGGDVSASVSLITLVPLILILMTITGAVYPAIDLTAGERERGTLEILVAAPVPRLGLLVAKYVAVLTVALLTAMVNLAAMSITVVVGGLGAQLFGDQGLTASIVAAVLGLTMLFATFFSAVLLTLTSFARSFKEAQAYLIPLMMASIAPGLLSLAPDLKLEGLLSIAPLANIVLLARDLLQGEAQAGAAAVVVISTLLYALAAIVLAARFFAAEAVLYSTESGWADLLQRPAAPRDVPDPANAMLCLALAFPAFFVALSLVLRLASLPIAVRLAAGSLATSLIFVALPVTAAIWRRVRLATGFRVGLRGNLWRLAIATPAAVVLGLSLWTFAHEIVVIEADLGIIQLTATQREQAAKLADELRSLPTLWVVVCLALVPAVCEELFFRGYLFSGLLGRTGPWKTIWTTALLFGLFHVVTPGGIVFARFVPSTFLGLVLGWIASRSGSVLPGMVMHACHNGLLMLLLLNQPELEARGWGVAEEAHLPLAWLAAAGAAAAIGWIAIRLAPPAGQPD